ncbi:MAG: RdgB/HAM1 family non-canonical purine NTP pyrophosphatase [Opitutales bacterium]|jgi:XTP/dITP diphosphohydrolase
MSTLPVIHLASNNAHKVGEIMRSVALLGSALRFEDATALGGMPEVDETGNSLLANARLKAHALADKAPDRWICADDTGLFVDALGGAPGIHTARYAGPGAGGAANNAKLLKALEGLPTRMRGAQFRCCLCVLDPDGAEHVYEGVFKGRIANALSGKGGFGYDPLFIPEGYACSVAELSDDEKNSISHRALAVKALVDALG